jgi:radical SAM protein with 4Fe4S-binding SPASM domain
MNRLRSFFRYHSQSRKLIYKFLKLCDKIPVYSTVYKKRIRSRTSKLSSFPEELSIETTNLCNAKCTVCAHPDMKRPKGKMQTDLVYPIIDQAGQGKVKKLYLSGFGEPLLDNRLPDFVTYAKTKGIDNISIVTNGYLLTTSVASDLVNAGLNEIIISTDGFTEKTYEKIRIGLKFEKLVENIKNLSSLKKRKSVRIDISCLDLIHNRAERHIAYRLFGRHVDNIYFRQVQGWTGNYAISLAGYSPHFELNPIPCRYLWDSMSVYIDGKVPVCCLDFEAEGVMGDVTKESIESIWRGERFNFYRQAHFQNQKAQLRPCSKCGYYSVWW